MTDKERIKAEATLMRGGLNVARNLMAKQIAERGQKPELASEITKELKKAKQKIKDLWNEHKDLT